MPRIGAGQVRAPRIACSNCASAAASSLRACEHAPEAVVRDRIGIRSARASASSAVVGRREVVAARAGASRRARADTPRRASRSAPAEPLGCLRARTSYGSRRRRAERSPRDRRRPPPARGPSRSYASPSRRYASGSDPVRRRRVQGDDRLQHLDRVVGLVQRLRAARAMPSRACTSAQQRSVDALFARGREQRAPGGEAGGDVVLIHVLDLGDLRGEERVGRVAFVERLAAAAAPRGVCRSYQR